MKEYAAIPKINKLYVKNKHWNQVRLEPSTILHDVKQKISAVLTAAEDAVKIIADKAQSLSEKANKHRGLINFDKDRVRFYNKTANQTSATTNEVFQKKNDKTLFYFNAKCNTGHQLPVDYDKNINGCYTPPEGFNYQSFFGENKVSFSSSAVQIPVDVYNENPDVLRDIAWSQDLEETFRSLFCNKSQKFPKFRWLYVASLSGVVRYYPSTPWNVPSGEIDLFDGRSLHWFVQTMTSPKDVIILIDISGSIVGLTLNLIQVSVSHVMKSLTRNDFFNVVKFNEKASFLNSKCPGLLPANLLNKQMVEEWMHNLQVKNSSSFEDGFDFAFNVLNEKNQTMKSSCNPVILLFTDGGAEYPKEAFTKWNDDLNTRVFTFSVGKHFSNTASLKEMACNNGGTFSTIPSDSATHFQTMKYLVKLSKPLVSENIIFSKWTLPYEDHLGIGSILTVTRPFYEDYLVSAEDMHHDHEIRVGGVAAVDVLYSDIQRTLNSTEYGSTTYFFGTDNNGLLFYHPLLKMGRLDEPVMVDLFDMEKADIEKVRRGMIDRNFECNVQLTKLVASPDRKYLTNSTFLYSYKALIQTAFSIAVAYPSTNQYRIQVLQTDGRIEDIIPNNSNVFSAAYGLVVEQRVDISSICSKSKNNSNETNLEDSESFYLDELPLKADAHISALLEKLDNPDQLRELIFHGQITKNISEIWSNSAAMSVFVATDSSPVVLCIKHNQNDQERRQVINIALSDPGRKDYFLRPLLSSSSELIYISFLNQSRINDTSINAHRTTSFVHSTSSAVKQLFIASQVVSVRNTRPAVAGFIMDYDFFRETIFNKTRDLCMDNEAINCEAKYNCWEKDRLCAVLDDGGYLLVTNQQEIQIGNFFGFVDGELMELLVKDQVFVKNNIDDHQAICEIQENDDSSAPSLLVPSIADLISTGWWFTSALYFGMQTFLSIILTTLHSVLSESNPQIIRFSSNEFLFPNKNVMKKHCVVRNVVFSLGTNNFSYSNITENRSYVSMRIPNSNTILVISHINKSPSMKRYPENALESVLAPEEGSCNHRYRRNPPEQCIDVKTFGKNKKENFKCGASQFPPPSRFIFALLLLPLLALIFL